MEADDIVHEFTPERINTFSDGVFAIVITIMILELKRPAGATFSALFAEWPAWVSYIVSYTFIAIVWINHHYLLKHVNTATKRLMWANFAHLFAVSLIPFLTDWMADTRLQSAPVMMYAFVFLLVNFTYLLLIRETILHKQKFKDYLPITVFIAKEIDIDASDLWKRYRRCNLVAIRRLFDDLCVSHHLPTP